MTEPKVTETEARQGRTGRPVLIVLVAALMLAFVAWAGAEIWGESTDAPSSQTATSPAGDNAPTNGQATSGDPAVPAVTDSTSHSDGGTGGGSQSNQP